MPVDADVGGERRLSTYSYSTGETRRRAERISRGWKRAEFMKFIYIDRNYESQDAQGCTARPRARPRGCTRQPKRTASSAELENALPEACKELSALDADTPSEMDREVAEAADEQRTQHDRPVPCERHDQRSCPCLLLER